MVIFLLGAPILEFNIWDLLDDEQFEQFGKVLGFWVLADFDNVRRYQMGMRSVSMPGEFVTNEVPLECNATYFLNYAPTEIRAKAEKTALELHEWLASVWVNDNDFVAALLADLMIRHRNPQGYRIRPDSFMAVGARLNTTMGTNPPGYVFAAFDKLLAELRESKASEIL
jgi:hypothetical protein